MATFRSEPTWSGDGRGRVLIEAAEVHRQQALSSALTSAGFDTWTCAGPEGADGRCPLSGDDGCRAAQEADVVVHTLRASDVRNLEVLRALRRSDPAMPVIVEVPEPTSSRDPETYEGMVTIAPPMHPDALVDAVRRAIADRERS